MIAARDPALTTQIPRTPQTRAWIRGAGVGLAAAALIALAFVWLSRPGPAPRGVDVLPVVAAAPVPVSEENEESEGAPLAMACSEPGTTLWISDRADVRVLRNDAQRARFAMARGQVLADIGENEPGFEFRVETPNLSVLARGTVFVVEIDPTGRESVRVHEGIVEVRASGAEGAPVLLAAGDQLAWGDAAPTAVAPEVTRTDLEFAGLDPARLEQLEPAPQPGVPEAPSREAQLAVATQVHPEPAPPATPTATELTRRAQDHQRAREYDLAGEVYRELIETHPGSVAAQNSRVALGQLELGASGRPDHALAHFDGYLAEAPDGALAEEARLGRVRALAAVGRHGEGVAASTEFLDRHPGSHARAEVLRLRGDALAHSGQREGAAADYRQVIDRWPDSAQALRAQRGLDSLDALP